MGRFDVWPRTVDQNRIANINQGTRGFVPDRLAPNIDFRYFDVIERPAGDWNSTRDTHCILGRRVKASDGRTNGREDEVDLDLFLGTDCSRRGYSYQPVYLPPWQ